VWSPAPVLSHPYCRAASAPPAKIVAELFEVSRRTIGNASAWVRPLLDQEQCTISRSAARYSSAAAVLAAVAGQESVSAKPETPL
jgi:hypothetical protein